MADGVTDQEPRSFTAKTVAILAAKDEGPSDIESATRQAFRGIIIEPGSIGSPSRVGGDQPARNGSLLLVRTEKRFHKNSFPTRGWRGGDIALVALDCY